MLTVVYPSCCRIMLKCQIKMTNLDKNVCKEEGGGDRGRWNIRVWVLELKLPSCVVKAALKEENGLKRGTTQREVWTAYITPLHFFDLSANIAFWRTDSSSWHNRFHYDRLPTSIVFLLNFFRFSRRSFSFSTVLVDSLSLSKSCWYVSLCMSSSSFSFASCSCIKNGQKQYFRFYTL